MSPRYSHWLDLGPGRWVKNLFCPTMSAQAFFADFYFYPVMSLLCLGIGIYDLGFLRGIALACFGLFIWTLLEYIIHRVALHHLVWFRDLHTAHHSEPRSYIGTPTLLSAMIFYLLGYLPMYYEFGRGIAAGAMAGLLAGYLAYVVTHWAVHHVNGNFVLLRRLKRLHAVHHHRDQDRNFGVTSAFWDRVFGTYGG